jgi:hypothetical protein
MPTISSFYGIKIYIYWADQNSHNLPHFHAFYGEYEAVYSLNGDLIVGRMPKIANSLVKTWALENLELIEYAWVQAVQKKPLPAIKGLK